MCFDQTAVLRCWQHSVQTAGIEVARRWCRTAVSCSSPGDTRRTPGQVSWWRVRTVCRRLIRVGVDGCNLHDRWQWRVPPTTACSPWRLRDDELTQRWWRMCQVLSRPGRWSCRVAEPTGATSFESLSHSTDVRSPPAKHWHRYVK